MTDLITEARELCETATPGPWRGIERGNSVVSHGVVTVAYDGIPQQNICSGISPKTGNAALIARSRTLVPELCDALEKATRWTNAEYKTPDIGQKVLLYLPHKESDQIRSGEYLGEGDYRVGNGLYRGMEIDAWIPLPEPPKDTVNDNGNTTERII